MKQNCTTIRPFSVAPPEASEIGVDPLELYAAGIDTSDYVAHVAPLLRAAVPRIGDLLDVGAGGGQLGQAVRDPLAAWIAIEPNMGMQQRLRALVPPPHLLPVGWQQADLSAGSADTVLAANIAAPLTDAGVFLRQCRTWARNNVIWLVPAQRGPRGLCLAGCLPPAWHGEDETPGIDVVLRNLPPCDQPSTLYGPAVRSGCARSRPGSPRRSAGHRAAWSGSRHGWRWRRRVRACRRSSGRR